MKKNGVESDTERKMGNVFHQVFGTEGIVITVLNKMGEMIILSILFIISCLPVITIGSAVASMYYCIVKCIRRERGYCVSEYLKSFRRTLKKGIVISVIIEALILFIAYILQIVPNEGAGTAVYGVLSIIAVVICCMSVYIFPILSRFQMKLQDMFALSFVIMWRHILISGIVLIIDFLLAYIYLYFLPIPTIVIIPAAVCYAESFLIEKTLLEYMPEAAVENEHEWYYERRH